MKTDKNDINKQTISGHNFKFLECEIGCQNSGVTTEPETGNWKPDQNQFPNGLHFIGNLIT